eukprot:2011997-Rhodomonas_salina.1
MSNGTICIPGHIHQDQIGPISMIAFIHLRQIGPISMISDRPEASETPVILSQHHSGAEVDVKRDDLHHRTHSSRSIRAIRINQQQSASISIVVIDQRPRTVILSQHQSEHEDDACNLLAKFEEVHDKEEHPVRNNHHHQSSSSIRINPHQSSIILNSPQSSSIILNHPQSSSIINQSITTTTTTTTNNNNTSSSIRVAEVLTCSRSLRRCMTRKSIPSARPFARSTCGCRHQRQPILVGHSRASPSIVVDPRHQSCIIMVHASRTHPRPLVTHPGKNMSVRMTRRYARIL